MPGETLRVGVDVGGTNTDAVIMSGREVLAAHKTRTTADVESGVQAALAEVLRLAAVSADRISAVMIGTTHFTNAFVQARSLKTNPHGPVSCGSREANLAAQLSRSATCRRRAAISGASSINAFSNCSTNSSGLFAR